jgi:chaperonin GroEL
MAQTEKDHRVLTYDKDARSALLKGAREMSNAVGVSYGPRGLNAVVEKSYGRPMVTRDGVTISKEVYSKVRDENMGMQLLNEASEATVRAVGDGTSATVILTYNLLELAHQEIAAGKHPMELKDEILKDSRVLTKKLDELSKPVSTGQLEHVATVSSGDSGFGKLIAEAVEQVGADGGIITQKSAIADVDKTDVDGYYIQPGYTALSAGKMELSDAYVVVSAKRITTGSEVIKLVNRVLERFWSDKNMQPGTPPNELLNIFFYGEFEGDAYESINANIQQQKFLGAIVKSPLQGGDMASQYLEDLAVYTGGKLIRQADKLDDVDFSYIGKAEKIRATNKEAIIFGGDAAQEDVENYASVIKERIAKEESDAISEKLKERVSKLEGKIAIFRIGGANETQREEREFRIDDAIQATKAAARGGVVAGAGTTLIELSKCDVGKLWKQSLRNTYAKLLTNAALPAEVKLHEVEQAGYPMGYNLRKDDQLIDVIKDGVLDPTLVVEQVVINSAATAADAVSAGLLITFVDREEK